MKQSGFTSRLGPAVALAALGLSLTAPSAEAISRYTATSMSCGAIRSTIQAEGAVILRWGKQRYGRFVAGSRYCDPGQRAVTAYVPSANKKSCQVRECKRCDFFDDDDFFRLGRC